MIRRRQTRVGGLVVLALIIQMLGSAATALAADQSEFTLFGMSGSTPVDADWTIEGSCDECIPDDVAGVVYSDSATYVAKVEAKVHLSNMTWSSNAAIEVAYDDQLLRQGAMLELLDKLAITGGTMTATGRITGSWGIERDGTTMVQDFGDFDESLNLSWTCPVPLPGESPRGCTSGNANTTVFDLKIFSVTLADVYLRLKVGVSLTASSSTTSIASSADLAFVGSGPAQSKTVSWFGSSPSTTTDSRHMSCLEAAGSDVTYRFTGGSTTGASHQVAPTLKLIGDLLVEPEVGPDVATPDIEFRSLTLAAIPVTMGLSGGNSETLQLGQLLPNNRPPVVDAGGGAEHTYSGNQGSPITFDGSGTSSVCGFPSLRWDFSDGGVAFGKAPQHTFQGSGIYSGLLTATDATGLTSSQTFSVAVANVAPRAVAGPNTTAAWGRSVAFNGAGQDPGADDQPTLTYVWEFGDGSPSAAGGPSTTHAYADPGSYTATLTVCDRGGLCDTDTRTITVRKRDVSIGALGDTAATYDTGSTRRASLVDEFGNAVNGRTISFTVDGAGAGSGVTNSDGRAQVAWTPALAAGTYATGASFAGDARYTAADGSGSVTIARKATSLEYTGARTGGPNKTVTLSAVVRDATGTPLAGRTVVFVLGSQTVNAATNASGVATASLKLTQKNGTYPLTATWTPEGADAARYTGSAASVTFKLQAK